MVALLTFLPTLVAAIVLGVSYALGRPVAFDKVGWLVSDAQVLFLALGVALILLTKTSAGPLPAWRSTANLWVGRVMAAFALFYLVAFALVTYHGP
jgi:hypothetical protein